MALHSGATSCGQGALHCAAVRTAVASLTGLALSAALCSALCSVRSPLAPHPHSPSSKMMDLDDGILTSAATASSLAALGDSSSSSAAAASAASAAASAAAKAKALAALTELSEVSVRLFTRHEELPQVPHTFLSVPASLARYGLSEIVNALTECDPPRPFDFLIEGSFLRGSLLSYLKRTAQTGEAGLEIEYVEAMPEPQSAPSRPHPDWIAAIDARAGKHIVTGCYDSVVRVYGATSPQDPALATGVGHASAVKSVAVIRAAESASSKKGAAAAFQIVSGSKDRSVRVWQYTPGQAAMRCVGLCTGHTDSVESVAVAPLGTQFASASWDSTIKLWDITNADSALPAEADAAASSAAAAPSAKKARKSSAAAAASSSVAPIPAFAPLSTLSGHLGAVTSLVFPHPAALYSGGMDHTLRQWDLGASGGPTATRTWFGTKVVNALDFSLAANVLASAHNDGVIRVWDPRVHHASKESMKLALKSHKLWVTSLRFNPQQTHHLASASLDHTVKLWDLRAALPLFTLRGHTDKVFGIDWDQAGENLFSGGADNQVQAHAVGGKVAATAASEEEEKESNGSSAAAATKPAAKGKVKGKDGGVKKMEVEASE